jgi:cytidyltransferase-like protein
MGGAAGHMAHPFDLGWVNSGTDLLDFFEKAKIFVEKKGAGAVKIDGVNVSFKVVGDDENKQFAVDRGSSKAIDIEGITMGRVDDRFPEGHGMRPAIRTLLSILNTALPDIKSELKDLGMWDDPSRFLNTEYVEGTTNVTEYDENFLAIHGLSQFYQKTAKSGPSKGNTRPGMERPEGVKAPSVEVPYNPQTMENLVKKLNLVAVDHGFQVYGSVPTEKMDDIDFSSTLSQPFTVKVSDDREITKSLKEWLSEATNPRYKTVTLKDGSKTHALHKQLYMNILNGEIPIVDLIEDNDAEAAIYGAVLMHATRVLGNDVMQALTSPMGDVASHEGIVMRDEKLFGPNPVKITGDFIVGNLGGGFGQVTEEEGEGDRSGRALPDSDAPNNEAEAQAGPVESRQKIALIPGAFKPPHRGHLGMVEEYAQRADNVVVLISSPLKSGRKLPNGREITAEDSKKIWETLVSHLPNVEVQISPHASPITATYDFIGKDGPLERGTEVILGVCNKGKDVERFRQADQYAKEGVLLVPIRECAIDPISHSTYYMDILGQSPLLDQMPSMTAAGKNPRDFHASDMRYLLGQAESDEEAIELLEDFTGEDNIFDVLAILGLNTGLNELSSMGGGSVEGAVGAKGGPWRHGKLDQENEEEKKRSRLKKENADLTMVDEIMRLFTERGIMR